MNQQEGLTSQAARSATRRARIVRVGQDGSGRGVDTLRAEPRYTIGHRALVVVEEAVRGMSPQVQAALMAIRGLVVGPSLGSCQSIGSTERQITRKARTFTLRCKD
jgi:hypothetical protein